MYDIEIEKYAEKYDLDTSLVRAVIKQESNFDTWAIRYEPHWKWFVTPKVFARKNGISYDTEKFLQSCSFGLMQVMGGVARELLYTDQLTKICTPEIGIELGCKKLRQNIDRWGSLDRALAAYNAGNPKFEAGQIYARKVFLIMEGFERGEYRS